MNTLQINAPLARTADVIKRGAELVLPPRRKLPADAAQLYLRNDKGPWERAAAPMMIEPLNILASREYNGIVVAGPARSSKTFSLIHGALTYIITCAPGDTLVVQMSQDAARDFSKTEVDRVIRHSPELAARLSPRPRDDNTFDKFFRSGIVLKLGWPAISQVSSKTLQYVFMTDYDRPENRDDVDGEGPLWDLAFKRIQTYMSRGKCLAESSPGGELEDSNWHPSSKHEAPPVPGILSLYNRGTRGRWYWPCQHCNHFFEAAPGVKVFGVPTFEECELLVRTNEPRDLAEKYCRIPCPECGALHEMADRSKMNEGGIWVHEGQMMEGTKLIGQRRRSNIASYWYGGCAATYQRWDDVLLKYFQGILTYVRSGDESGLKAMTGTDLAEPYVSRRAAKKRGVEELMDRQEEWEEKTVPKGVRFLTAAIDTQAHRFVVEVFGWGVDLESWLVDRYSISSSQRPEGGGRMAALDPAGFLEDWDPLIGEVIHKTYIAEWDSQIVFPIRLALCDSGGRDGVTMRAYQFWRKLKSHGLGSRFQLVKGDGRLDAPATKLAWPDARGRKERTAGAKGDVPVWFVNTNLLKDGIVGDLARDETGPGYVHLPRWVDSDFFSELTSESRGVKGWTKKQGQRNEAFDLHVYNRAATIILKADQINWQKPPIWASEPEARQQNAKLPVRDIGALARALNGGTN